MRGPQTDGRDASIALWRLNFAWRDAQGRLAVKFGKRFWPAAGLTRGRYQLLVGSGRVAVRLVQPGDPGGPMSFDRNNGTLTFYLPPAALAMAKAPALGLKFTGRNAAGDLMFVPIGEAAPGSAVAALLAMEVMVRFPLPRRKPERRGNEARSSCGVGPTLDGGVNPIPAPPQRLCAAPRYEDDPAAIEADRRGVFIRPATIVPRGRWSIGETAKIRERW